MFKKKEVSSGKPTPIELAAQVDADEAAAAKDEPISQDDHGQWMTPPSGRTRVTRQQAQAIVRLRIGMRRPTLSERIEFQAEFEVIEDEPLPLPTSPTHHAEIIAARVAKVAAAIPKAQQPPTLIAKVRAALLMKRMEAVPEPQATPAAPPAKPKATFFT